MSSLPKLSSHNCFRMIPFHKLRLAGTHQQCLAPAGDCQHRPSLRCKRLSLHSGALHASGIFPSFDRISRLLCFVTWTSFRCPPPGYQLAVQRWWQCPKQARAPEAGLSGSPCLSLILAGCARGVGHLGLLLLPARHLPDHKKGRKQEAR